MTQLFYELHGKFKTVTVNDVYLKKNKTTSQFILTWLVTVVDPRYITYKSITVMRRKSPQSKQNSIGSLVYRML